MNGCIYRTDDDKCEFWSDYGKGIVWYCDPCDCEEKTQSRADRIRSMSDEELASFAIYAGCPFQFGASHAFKCKLGEVKDGCKGCWLDWLKQGVDE